MKAHNPHSVRDEFGRFIPASRKITNPVLEDRPVRDSMGRFVNLDKHQAPELPDKPTAAPKGFEAGVAWDGNRGELATGPISGPPPRTWDDLLKMWELDPNEVEVIEPVNRRSWDAQTKDGIVRMNYYKANLRRKRTTTTDLESLMAEFRKHRPAKAKAPTGELAYMHISGDWQAGKPGTQAMVDRFLLATDAGVARLKMLRKMGIPIGPIYLPQLGDCVENVSGHYAMQTFSVELSLTEQIRLVRRMLLHQVKSFAPLSDRVVVPVVPGNHDESLRSSGKAMTNFSDSFALDVASQVSDIIAENPAVYGHVFFVLPKPETLDLTLNVCGTVTGFAHGHQFGSQGAHKWWASQGHGRQQIGEATLLLAGHLHHLRVESPGSKTFIQVPSLDSGSKWWEARTGQASWPGVVSLVVGESAGAPGWNHLAVL